MFRRLWCEEMKRMRNPYKRKLKPSITCEPLFSSPLSVIKLPRSTEGLSCIWTPCWALLSADVFTVSQPPVWIDRRRDDNNDNKKLHFIAVPGGRWGGGRLGIWQCVPAMCCCCCCCCLLTCVQLRVCTIFGVCIHVLADMQEKWQVCVDSYKRK